MKDIPDQLREHEVTLMHEAADLIESLEAQNKRMLKELCWIAGHAEMDEMMGYNLGTPSAKLMGGRHDTMIFRARLAVEELAKQE